MVMTTVQMGEHVQTMDRRAATVVFAELIVIAIWYETLAVGWAETVKQVHGQGPS